MHVQMGMDASVFTVHGTKIGGKDKQKKRILPPGAGDRRSLHGDPLEHPGGDGEARGEGSREVVGLHPRLAVVEVLRVAVRVVGLPVRSRRGRRHAAGGAEQDPLLLPHDAAPQRPQPRSRRRPRGPGRVVGRPRAADLGGGGG